MSQDISKNNNETPVRRTPVTAIPGYEMTERGPEVFAPVDGPLEAPVKDIEKGPLYMAAEEVLPSVDEDAQPLTPGEEALASTAVSRRDFLKLFSAAAAASSAACVRRPL